MSIQTTATPINGEEARKMIDKHVKNILDNTPGLDFATSYHQFVLELWFKITGYPTDEFTKYPMRDAKFNIEAPSLKSKEGEEAVAYAERLETIRQELIDKVEEITELLDNLAPVTTGAAELDTLNPAGQSEPDRLRIEQGLPIPVVTKASGRNVETYVDVSKTTGGFQFGRGNR